MLAAGELVAKPQKVEPLDRPRQHRPDRIAAPRDDVAAGFGAFMQLNVLVLSYVASAAVSAAVAVVAWRRRHMVGARELALLILAVGW